MVQNELAYVCVSLDKSSYLYVNYLVNGFNVLTCVHYLKNLVYLMTSLKSYLSLTQVRENTAEAHEINDIILSKVFLMGDFNSLGL